MFVVALDESVIDRVEKLWVEWPQTHPTSTYVVFCRIVWRMSDGSSSSDTFCHRHHDHLSSLSCNRICPLLCDADPFHGLRREASSP